MVDEIRADVSFVASVLAHVVSVLAARYDEGNRLLHRARQAWRSADQLKSDLDDHDDLQRAGAS